MPPVFRLGPPKWVCLAKRHGGFIVLHYRYFVEVGKRAPSRRKRAYFTAEFKSIYGDRARVLRPFLACISLLNKVPVGEAGILSSVGSSFCAIAPVLTPKDLPDAQTCNATVSLDRGTASYWEM